MISAAESALLSFSEASFGGFEPTPELARRAGGPLRLRVPTGSLNQVAGDLTLLDRELRRAALFIVTGDPDVSLRESKYEELKVTATGPGSLWVEIEAALGPVADVLLSDPVQLLAVTDWLIKAARPLARQLRALAMPPAEARIPERTLVDELSDFAIQNPRRPIRFELTTDGVVVEIGAERRWWSSR